jgi:hydrogenase-4 component E
MSAKIIISVLFGFSLVYLSYTERFKSYILLLAFQGVLMFSFTLAEVIGSSALEFLLLLLETLAFKAILVPYLLTRILKVTGIYRVHRQALPASYNILFSIIALFASIAAVSSMQVNGSGTIYMITSFFTLFTGLILIITHRLMFSHLVGFLVIENAAILFSYSLTNRFPLLINIGITLDILITVLILGMLLTRAGSKYGDLKADNLTSLKD